MNIKSILCSIVFSATAGLAQAQGFGDRPVRLVVPYGPGGTSDMVARSLQEPLQERLKRSVLVENKAGATGSIAARMVATSAPDGNVLLVPNSANTLAPLLQEKQPFDYRTSFVPISQVADAPMVMLVSGDLPVSNVAEFIAYAKANPGKVNYGAPGVGSFGHLAAELLQKEAGIQMYFVPYQNGTQVNLAVAAGEVKMMIISLPDARTALGLGKGVKALAVTSPEPTPLMPGVPAMSATIRGYSVLQHFGLLAPAGTPPHIVQSLGEAVRVSLSDDSVRKQYITLGLSPISSSSDELAKIMAEDYERWEPIIKSLGLKKD
jgi:tripartite-type tricarboxylate transporter receptor subunit TctC